MLQFAKLNDEDERIDPATVRLVSGILIVPELTGIAATVLLTHGALNDLKNFILPYLINDAIILCGVFITCIVLIIVQKIWGWIIICVILSKFYF